MDVKVIKQTTAYTCLQILREGSSGVIVFLFLSQFLVYFKTLVTLATYRRKRVIWGFTEVTLDLEFDKE